MAGTFSSFFSLRKAGLAKALRSKRFFDCFSFLEKGSKSIDFCIISGTFRPGYLLKEVSYGKYGD